MIHNVGLSHAAESLLVEQQLVDFVKWSYCRMHVEEIFSTEKIFL